MNGGSCLNTTNKANRRMASTALIVMLSIILSRLTGFIRETLVPNFIGVNQNGDAYNMAFSITGLMYNLLIGGAIAAALIPVLSGYLAKDQEEEGWKCVSTFMNIIFLAMVVVCLFGMLFAPALVRIFAGGFTDPEQIKKTITLVRILFPSVAFLMLTGLLNGVLNAYQRFVASSFGPSLYNLGCSVSIVLFGQSESIHRVAYGVVATSFLYFCLQLVLSYKNLKSYIFSIQWRHPGFIKLFKLAIPSMIASSVVSLNILILSSYATYFETGTVTAYYVADKIWQMPFGIIAQGVGIAILPSISAMYALKQFDSFNNTIYRACSLMNFVMIPCVILFIVLRNPIIETVFRFTQRFGEEYVGITADILGFFALAMLSQSFVTVLNRIFFSMQDTKTPLYTGLSTLFIIAVLGWILTRYTQLGGKGLALAYTVSSFINAGLLITRLKKKRAIAIFSFQNFILRLLPSSLAITIFLVVSTHYFFSFPTTKFLQFFILGSVSLLSFFLYWGIAFLLKHEEAIYIRRLVKEKCKL